MTDAVELLVPQGLSSEKPPGFLLEPFGWATVRVVAILRDEPVFLSDLLHLSRIRMHLLALALAHVEGPIPAGLVSLLFRGSAGAILDAAVGRRPAGLKRAAHLMPHMVLEEESYRRLVRLLDDSEASKLLHHAAEIDDSAIMVIHDIPAGLRPVVFTLQECFGDMHALADGLRCISSRKGALSFDDLIAELARLPQPGQLIAKVKSLVESLPLPDALPPLQVGHARRIDSADELRSLAKRWRNCLEGLEWDVSQGVCAIYLWEHAGIQAACAAWRYRRLGWFLDDVKGPQNAEIERPHLGTILTAFEDAGIPRKSKIRSIQRIIECGGLRELQRRRPHRCAQTIPLPDDSVLQDVS